MQNTEVLFCSCDLDPMTLKYELDLDIVKVFLRTENEVSRSRLSKVRALQAHTQMRLNTLTCRPKN